MRNGYNNEGDGRGVVKGFTWTSWLKLTSIIAAAIVLCYCLISFGVIDLLRKVDVMRFAVYIQSFGASAVAVGAMAIFLQALFPIVPFIVVAGTNVIVFGFWEGFTINYSMNVLAATAAFLFARYIGRDWVQSKAQKNKLIQTFNESTKKHGFWYILLARCIVIVPGTVINYGSALSVISFRQYILATVIGNLPIIFLESLIGHDLLFFKHNKERLLWLFLFFLAVVWIGTWIKKKWLK
jgi:uncharacterized membrane protein YdjX (TVP38/TMEM64 family)